MEESNWATVLNYLYKENREVSSEFDDSHDIVEYCGLSVTEVKISFEYMNDAGLVNLRLDTEQMSGEVSNISDAKQYYILSTKGFDVAHERELRKQQERHDRIISAFTVVLGASAFIQARSSISALPDLTPLYINFYFITTIIIAALIIRGDSVLLSGD